MAKNAERLVMKTDKDATLEIKKILLLGFAVFGLSACALDASISDLSSNLQIEGLENLETISIGEVIKTSNDFEMTVSIGEISETVTTSNDFTFDGVVVQ